MKNEAQVLYIFNRDNPDLGGYTIAYEQCPYYEGSNPKMANVAVSYCSPGDRFDRKRGRTLALLELREGNSIKLPIYMHGSTPEAGHEFLKAMFDSY